MLGTKQILTRRLVAWYRRERRDLPWRVAAQAPPTARPDPYHVLVSEAMLQQTQVATVIPYFRRFIQRFPTIEQLAASDPQDVLRLWQGLGYYSRARHLLSAAQVVVRDFDAQVPDDVETLRQLPGVGRYTAGAIASLAFDRRAAIIDGNVARVLCRLHCIEDDPRQKDVVQRLWQHANELLPRTAAGDFNSALMELGATVCTPKLPKCLECPIQRHCQAFAANAQERIPRPRKIRQIPLLRRRVLCIRRTSADGQQWLLEQRPATGRWAGMWQFITRPTGSKHWAHFTTRPHKVGMIKHALTHRRYEFEVYVCETKIAAAPEACPGNDKGHARWIKLSDLHRFPLPRPHLRIAEMLRQRPSRQRTFAPTSPISYIRPGPVAAT